MTEAALQPCANAIARPVVILTRDSVLAQRLVDFLLYGANGPDGKAIADPFPEIRRRLAYAETAALATSAPAEAKPTTSRPSTAR